MNLDEPCPEMGSSIWAAWVTSPQCQFPTRNCQDYHKSPQFLCSLGRLTSPYAPQCPTVLPAHYQSLGGILAANKFRQMMAKMEHHWHSINHYQPWFLSHMVSLRPPSRQPGHWKGGGNARPPRRPPWSKMAIEIVDFPIKNGDFPLQTVRSPEGTQKKTDIILYSKLGGWGRGEVWNTSKTVHDENLEIRTGPGTIYRQFGATKWQGLRQK